MFRAWLVLLSGISGTCGQGRGGNLGCAVDALLQGVDEIHLDLSLVLAADEAAVL
jgi:hypothetical protein